MARKKAETAKVDAVTEKPKTQPVRLDLSPDIHKKLRVVAAENETSMAVFARQIVERAVTELYGKRK